MDKGGNYIGWLHVDKKNLSVHLVEEGLSSVHVTAESSKFYHLLTQAQDSAKKKQLNKWKSYVEEEEKEEKVKIILILLRSESYTGNFIFAWDLSFKRTISIFGMIFKIGILSF